MIQLYEEIFLNYHDVYLKSNTNFILSLFFIQMFQLITNDKLYKFKWFLNLQQSNSGITLYK